MNKCECNDKFSFKKSEQNTITNNKSKSKSSSLSKSVKTKYCTQYLNLVNKDFNKNSPQSKVISIQNMQISFLRTAIFKRLNKSYNKIY